MSTHSMARVCSLSVCPQGGLPEAHNCQRLDRGELGVRQGAGRHGGAGGRGPYGRLQDACARGACRFALAARMHVPWRMMATRTRCRPACAAP